MVAPGGRTGFADRVPGLWLFVAVGRRQWRSLAVVAVLIGLTGGAVLASVAGARRSTSSLGRFERAAHAMDAFVTTSEGETEPLRSLLDGPVVRRFMEMTFVFAGPAAEGSPEIFVFAPVSPTPNDIEQGVLLEGRRVDPTEPDEVVLFETTAELLGVSAGETLELATLSPAQAALLVETGAFSQSPDGPTIPLRVVGIARNVKDLAAQRGEANFTFLSPAFLERYAGEVGVGTESFAVDLAGGAGSVPTLRAEIEKAHAGSTVPGIESGGQTQAVEDSIVVISRALLIFAVVVALAGATWISTAIARQHRGAAEDVAVMRALGLTNGESRVLLAGALAPGLVAGVLLAGAVAILLSPLLPIGLARRPIPIRVCTSMSPFSSRARLCSSCCSPP